MRERQRAEPTRVIDATTLKAFAHPLRVRIVDSLATFGAQTASGLGERLGESSGSMSYHLRQLAKHDLVREVEGKGSARERWWVRTPQPIALVSAELPDTPAARSASDLVEWEWERQRQLVFHDFMRRGRDELAPEWVAASTSDTVNMTLTSEQLHELVEEVEGVLSRYRLSHAEQRENPVEGSRPVQLHFNAFPVLDTAPDAQTT
jgi:DNA-binding transcriptional ArsR family regulator